MADMIEKTGKTVQQAINDALETLGAGEDDVVIEVLDEGEPGGLLGIGRRLAKVRVTLESAMQDPQEIPGNRDDQTTAADEGDQAAADTVYYGDDEYTNEQESQVESETLDYVAAILKGIGIHGRISSFFEEGTLHIDINGKDCGAAIGHHGETLDAIQYMASLVANKNTEEHVRVVVDIGGYRRRREQTLIGMAQRAADKVSNSGRSFRMDPMNPAERRIVHSSLQEYPGITTYSEGVEPERYVIIAPVEQP